MTRIIQILRSNRDSIVFIACFLSALIAVQINDDRIDDAIRLSPQASGSRQ